ncbi:MAG: thioredoxin [Eubacteriales bacterium]
MAIIELTAEEYEDIVEKSEKPVLIDFWAPWCGPCRMLSPIVDEISDERDDIVFCKVNVDEESELAQKFGVMSIPTLVYLEGGETKRVSVGYKPKDDVIAFLDE